MACSGHLRRGRDDRFSRHLDSSGLAAEADTPGAQRRLGRRVAKPGQCAGVTSIRRAHAGGVDKPTTQKGKTMRATRGRAGQAATSTENGAAADASAPTHQRMRAVVRHEYGSANVVRVEEIDRPTISADEVLIRVHAAGM